MNTEQMEKNENNPSSFADACLASCRKLLGRIATVKETVLNEFRDTLDAHDKMLRLAVNEAEALAWETDYPELVFPTLAQEKAAEVTSWQARQRELSNRFSPIYPRRALTPALATR